MPKLIVYVKSSTWQRVVDQAGSDAAVLCRALSIEAIEDFVNSSSGVVVGDPAESGSAREQREEMRTAPVAAASRPERTASDSLPSYFPDREAKADFVAKKLK